VNLPAHNSSKKERIKSNKCKKKTEKGKKQQREKGALVMGRNAESGAGVEEVTKSRPMLKDGREVSGGRAHHRRAQGHDEAAQSLSVLEQTAQARTTPLHHVLFVLATNDPAYPSPHGPFPDEESLHLLPFFS
jgi:hypothetical protein